MSRLERLLTGEPRIATAGIEMMAEGVEAQGAPVTRTEWRPPLEGTEVLLISSPSSSCFANWKTQTQTRAWQTWRNACTMKPTSWALVLWVLGERPLCWV